jgi:HAE1 family hydrophobic/amphiphilic exporter-1
MTLRLPSFAINKPVTTFMIVIIILILGFVSLGKMNVDLLPDVDVPVAVILTIYPGASAEEVETLVTKPIEEAVSSVERIKTVVSRSEPNVSMVEVKFNWGTNLDISTMDIREKLEIVKRELPDEVEEPIVSKLDPSMMPVLIVGMSGDKSDTMLKQIAEDTVVKRIEHLEGVSSVKVMGGVERQIRVFLMPDKMEGYGVALTQVIQALKMENMNVPGANVEYGDRELIVRTTGEFEDIEEIKNLIVANRQGAIVYLKDIARVEDAAEDRKTYARMNEKQGLRILVQKQSDANTVRVADMVKEELEKISDDLPKGVEMYEVIDQSDYIKRAIDNVSSNAIQGAILAVVVIFVFLHSIRPTLVIAVSIPISIITTFVAMYFMGMTLNIMSLGGLAVGVGMLVDNTIVVLENIYRHQELGKGTIQAAELGANEMSLSIIASTLTTIAVFFPIVFIEGITGTIFKELSLTITFSLLASLLVSQTFVPVLCSKFVNVEIEKRRQRKGMFTGLFKRVDGFYDRVDKSYGKLLGWAIDNRKKVIFAMIGLLILSLCLSPLVGREFFPETDEGKITVDVNLDIGTKLEKTDELVKQIEEIAMGIPEVEMVSSQVGTSTLKSFLGTGSGEIASLDIKLVQMKDRKRGTKQIVEELREEVSHIAGAEIDIKSATIVSRIGSVTGSDKPVQIGIKGEDMEVLEQLANAIKEKVKKVPGAREVDTTLSKGRPEVKIKLDRGKASLYGLDAAKIAVTIRSSINGAVATQYKVAGTEVDVNVQLEEYARKTLENLESMSIMTPLGVSVPLNLVAEFEVTEGIESIKREDQERMVYVSADIFDRSLGDVMKDIDNQIAKMQIPEGYTIKYEGQNKLMEEAFDELKFAFVLAVILVYAVMASQFESFLYPFTIMFTIPFAAIGVIFGLLITRKSFNVPAFMGLIMLAGIAVNNAIVLVDYINQLKAGGLSTKEAIIEAGPTRLRPVMMTTLTTLLGLIPLAVGIGEGGEIQSPLAVVVIGGLAISTLLTLVAVPVLYSIFDDWQAAVQRKLANRKDVGTSL